MSNKNYMDLQHFFYESADVKKKFIDNHGADLQAVIDVILEALWAWKKILICGNGWSAADAQHRAAELIGRYKTERPSLPAIALTTDTSIITAIGNDYGYEHIFAKQVEWLGREWDVLIGISTSGNSSNVIIAVEAAKKRWIGTIGLLGKDGGKLKSMMDYVLIVPSNDTARIQECHQTIYHTICECIDEKFT